MTADVTNLALISDMNGFGLYRYDTLDHPDTVEAANYFNNKTNTIRLRVGDLVHSISWATAIRTGTISYYKLFIVTNVIADDAAASAGAVNMAEAGIASSGVLSSGT